MTITMTTKKSGDRSPNFPFIPLETALARALQFYEKEKRGSAPFQVAADHWKYSPSSSGALQTAAAMKGYGLMVDEGSGANRKLKLTELALRILLDGRPDSVEREQFKRQAALAPAVAAEVYEKWNGKLPSDATLQHYLVLDRGFNQSTATRSLNIIKLNQEFTKSVIGEFKSVQDETKTEHNLLPKIPEVELQYRPGNPAPVLVPKTPRTSFPPENFTHNGINIAVQFSAEPTLETYNFLKRYIEFRIGVLNDSSGGKDKDDEKS